MTAYHNISPSFGQGRPEVWCDDVLSMVALPSMRNSHHVFFDARWNCPPVHRKFAGRNSVLPSLVWNPVESRNENFTNVVALGRHSRSMLQCQGMLLQLLLVLGLLPLLLENRSLPKVHLPLLLGAAPRSTKTKSQCRVHAGVRTEAQSEAQESLRGLCGQLTGSELICFCQILMGFLLPLQDFEPFFSSRQLPLEDSCSRYHLERKINSWSSTWIHQSGKISSNINCHGCLKQIGLIPQASERERIVCSLRWSLVLWRKIYFF